MVLASVRRWGILSAIAVGLTAVFLPACLADAPADVQKCKSYVQQRDFPKAISCLQELLAAHPSGVPEEEIRAWLMDAHLGNNETELGMSEYQSLLKQYPDYAAELHHIVGRRFQRQSKFPEAIAELKTALQLNKLPKGHETVMDMHRRLMVAYIGNKDLANALSELRIVMDDYPDEASTYVVGEAMRWQSKLADAMAELKKTAEALPKNAPRSRSLRTELAKCYIHQKSWDDAVSVLDALARDYPQNAAQYRGVSKQCDMWTATYEEASIALKEAADHKGAASPKDLKRDAIKRAMSSKDWKGAIAKCQELARDYPGELASWQPTLIHAYLDDKQYESAIPICKEIIARDIDSGSVVDAMTVLAECLQALGRGPEAAAFRSEFYAKHSDRKLEADWACARAAYFAEKDYPKAETLFKAFIANYPNDPAVSEAKSRLAKLTLWQLQKPAEARTLLQEVLRRQPNSTDAKFDLAYCSYCENDWTVARAAFQSLYDTSKETNYRASALSMVGDCCARLGDKAAAKQAYEAVLSEYPRESAASGAARRLAKLQ